MWSKKINENKLLNKINQIKNGMHDGSKYMVYGNWNKIYMQEYMGK